MKTFFTVFFLSVATLAGAQNYQIGDNVVSVGVGFGSSYGYRLASQTPAISLQFERGLIQLGPGVISVGGYVGYKNYRYSSNFGNGYSYKQTWRYIIPGVRAAWHLQELDGLNLEKWDLYGGVMLSFNIVRYTYSDNDPTFDYQGEAYGNGAGFSTFLGARYFFKENIAVMGELGYGIAYFNLGVSFRL
jgi:hypothetical protein